MLSLNHRLLTTRCSALTASPSPSPHKPPSPPVVMISIDGTKAEYITQAAQHNLKVPVLRSFMPAVPTPKAQSASSSTPATPRWSPASGPPSTASSTNTLFDPLREHPTPGTGTFPTWRCPPSTPPPTPPASKPPKPGWPIPINASIDYNIAEGTQSEHADKPASSPFYPARHPRPAWHPTRRRPPVRCRRGRHQDRRGHRHPERFPPRPPACAPHRPRPRGSTDTAPSAPKPTPPWRPSTLRSASFAPPLSPSTRRTRIVVAFCTTFCA